MFFRCSNLFSALAPFFTAAQSQFDRGVWAAREAIRGRKKFFFDEFPKNRAFGWVCCIDDVTNENP
jgi:hypothetical protein